MPSVSGFAITRTTLVAGTTTEIRAARDCQRVSIGNATPDDLKVYTIKDDETAQMKITAGYWEDFELQRTSFLKEQIAFWVNAVVGGDVVVKWL